MLKRLIVIQGDTEPGSVEQQRFLGLTAPSLYDMRNLFQVNVEEGRHLWAMVYLLQKYFGRDGREEADDLLRRSSGSEEAPRMLGAFNEETPDWLSFFMFTYFTDRDGKMQLGIACAVRVRSAFPHLPLHADRGSAPHVRRGNRRWPHRAGAPVDAMKEGGDQTTPPTVNRIRDLGVIDLPTIQKKLNLHYTLSPRSLRARRSRPTPPMRSTPASRAGTMEHRIDDDHQAGRRDLPGLEPGRWRQDRSSRTCQP